MRILWAVCAVLVVLALAGIAVTPLQAALVALLVHCLGGTGLIPS